MFYIVVDIPWCLFIILSDQHQKGNLFTLFLHSPLMALCYVCNIVDIPIMLWDKCQTQIDKFMVESSKLFIRSRKLGSQFWCVVWCCLGFEGNEEIFYLTIHSTHFIYGYMVSDSGKWLVHGYSYQFITRDVLHELSHKQDSTYQGLCYTVVEHWFQWEIAQ